MDHRTGLLEERRIRPEDRGEGRRTAPAAAREVEHHTGRVAVLAEGRHTDPEEGRIDQEAVPGRTGPEADLAEHHNLRLGEGKESLEGDNGLLEGDTGLLVGGTGRQVAGRSLAAGAADPSLLADNSWGAVVAAGSLAVRRVAEGVGADIRLAAEGKASLLYDQSTRQVACDARCANGAG